MRLKPRTRLAVMLIVLIGLGYADAAPSRWQATLTVDTVEAGVQGIAVGDQFVANFSVDPALFDLGPGVHPGGFRTFDLTIGGVNWNESQPQLPDFPPTFLISAEGIIAWECHITDTMPAHPDLHVYLPQSLPRWEVIDNDPANAAPLFGGNFGGTYAVTPIPVPSAFALATLGAALATRRRRRKGMS